VVPGCELLRARRGNGGAVLRGCRDHRCRLPRGLHQIFRTLSEGERPRARKRAEMLSGPTHLRGAIQAWDQQDDSVLAPDEVSWADQVQAGGGRTEAKAKIRWAED
jgi:hypothetical protein